MPLGEPVDTLRDMATACTLVGGIALVLVRLRVEQRLGRAGQPAAAAAGHGVRAGRASWSSSSAATAASSTRTTRFAGRPATRREELESLAPSALVAAGIGGVDSAVQSEPEGAEGDAPQRVAGAQGRLRRSRRRASLRRSSTPAAASPISSRVIRDITEELRLREQLVRGERLSALGEFVSGVAHEINNPLQSIIGSLELVLDQHLDAALRGDIERARFEAGRAGRIVRNLLRFVRQAPNERLLLDLNEIVKATMSVRAYELEMAGIQIREEYAPLLPLVLANRDEIQQVILNLVMNAQQAMSDPAGDARALGADVHVRRRTRSSRCATPARAFRAELAGKVFEPFFTTKSVGSRSRPRPVALARHRQRAPGPARARRRAVRLLLPSDASGLRLSGTGIDSLMWRWRPRKHPPYNRQFMPVRDVVHPQRRAHADRSLRRILQRPAPSRAGRGRGPRRDRARRPDRRRRGRGGDRPWPSGRLGPEPRAPGRPSRRHPRSRSGADDQQGVRVEPAGDCLGRAVDHARRVGRRAGRRHRVDEPDAVSDRRDRRALGPSHGQLHAGRRDVSRRLSVSDLEPDHGRDGGNPRPPARHHARAVGCVRARQPAQGEGGDRRRALRARDRAGDAASRRPRRGRRRVVDRDEHPRGDTTLESLRQAADRCSATSKGSRGSSPPARRRASPTAGRR